MNPQEALDIVGAVRALLDAPDAPLDAGSSDLWRAECALNAAWANIRLGRFAAAFSEAEKGLGAFRLLDNMKGVAGCMMAMGLATGEDGKHDEAVKLCLEAAALFQEIGDQVGRARAINASGTSYRRLGDSARAIEAYGESMSIARDNGDGPGVSRALCNIGYVYLQEKKFEQAIDHARRALAMERSHGNLTAELSNCCNLIQALVAAGRAKEAVDFMAGYDMEKLSGSGLLSFLELSHSLSVAYMETGRSAEAGILLNLGIERARRDGNLRQLGVHLVTYAQLLRTAPVSDGAPRADRFAAARSALEEALTHGRSSDLEVVQGAHEEFCALCREEGSWDEAFEHLEEAHRIAFKLSSASADERLARQRSERDAAEQKARADTEARQHEIERKMLQSQKAESLGVLAGGMVHHFNNLLTSILGNAELAELNADLVKGALAEIKVSGRRAADLCRQIMMYTGRSVHRMEAVDLLELVRESIRLLRVARISDCEITCEFPPDPIFVWGDRAELTLIILNLVTNSAEARAKAILFRASVSRGGSAGSAEFVDLRIIDNGEGMTPEVYAHIFEPFYSTRFTGRGLGLPAAMGLVRSHNGTISVESSPGSGTTVHLRIPVTQREAMVPVKSAADPEIKGTRVVLIAEDEELVRNMIVMYMSRSGWKTIEAEDGDSAIHTYREHAGQIDLFLSDYLMPKVNGLEAAQQIRLLNPKLPVILMSGFLNEATLENFRSRGFEHFLKKPFQFQELREQLKAASASAS